MTNAAPQNDAAPGEESAAARQSPLDNDRRGRPAKMVSGIHEAGAAARFIPINRSSVIERLTSERYWQGHDQAAVKDALHCLGRLRQQDSCLKLDELMDSYQPFNPDSALRFTRRLTWEQKAELRETFIGGVEQLVFRANFTPISREELEQVLSQTSPYGVDVDVDLDEFDPLLPYYRGVSNDARSRRDWRWAYLRKIHYILPTYDRLFLALTLKSVEKRIAEIQQKCGIDRKQAEKRVKRMRRALPDWVTSDQIYLKMFKNVPQVDIDMLLPNGGVKFRQIDRMMLWVSGGGSAVYALVISILKVVAAVTISPILLFMTLFGFGGALWRQLSSVLNTRNRYLMELSQKLYFHNMSNNQGVLTLLVDESEEEDIKEDSLLYAFLLNAPVQRGDLGGIKTAIENFLRREFDILVDFDCEEALARLKARGLVEETHGVIRAMPAAEAAIHLRRQWGQSIELCAGACATFDAPRKKKTPQPAEAGAEALPPRAAGAARPESAVRPEPAAVAPGRLEAAMSGDGPRQGEA